MPERRNEVCVKRTDLQHLACEETGAQVGSGSGSLAVEVFPCQLCFHPHLSPCTKINSEWSNGLNLKTETAEENIGNVFQDTEAGKGLLDRTQHRKQSQESTNEALES